MQPEVKQPPPSAWKVRQCRAKLKLSCTSLLTAGVDTGTNASSSSSSLSSASSTSASQTVDSGSSSTSLSSASSTSASQTVDSGSSSTSLSSASSTSLALPKTSSVTVTASAAVGTNSNNVPLIPVSVSITASSPAFNQVSHSAAAVRSVKQSRDTTITTATACTTSSALGSFFSNILSAAHFASMSGNFNASNSLPSASYIGGSSSVASSSLITAADIGGKSYCLNCTFICYCMLY